MASGVRGTCGQVTRAVMQARTLVGYLSERGITVDAATLAVVIEGARVFDGGEAPALTSRADLEEKVWQALATLSRLAAPVTVDCIQAMSPEDGPICKRLFGPPVRRSRFQASASAYQKTAFAVFALLVLVQVYWFACFFMESILYKAHSAQMQLVTLATVVSDPAAASQHSVLPGAVSTVSNLRRVNEQVVGAVRDYAMMLFHDSPALQAAFFSDACFPEETGAGWNRKVNEFGALTDADLSTLYCLYWNVDRVAGALNLFFLPVLYGLLGSVSLVIRRLSVAPETMSYTHHASIRYRLRFWLGAPIGFLVPLFISSDTANALIGDVLALGVPSSPGAAGLAAGYEPGIQPGDISSRAALWGLAFVAGYSVELLFSTLDAILVGIRDRIMPRPGGGAGLSMPPQAGGGQAGEGGLMGGGTGPQMMPLSVQTPVQSMPSSALQGVAGKPDPTV